MLSTPSTPALIRSLEEQRYAAMQRGDFATFASLAHPALVYTHSNGVVDTLDSYMAKCERGHYIYHRLDCPIDDVHIIGEVALVHGQMNGEITSGGVPKTLRNRVLSVWRLLDGQWRLFAYQPTPVK